MRLQSRGYFTAILICLARACGALGKPIPRTPSLYLAVARLVHDQASHAFRRQPVADGGQCLEQRRVVLALNTQRRGALVLNADRQNNLGCELTN
jgi:hypothetical protein